MGLVDDKGPTGVIWPVLRPFDKLKVRRQALMFKVHIAVSLRKCPASRVA